MRISQDIEIRTTAGVRFDVMPDVTVETVMGGFSLLELSQRSVGYTTTFNLPRTPTNESILEFASETTRSNRPNVAVYVRFGMKELSGYLRVLSFSDVYSVSITFSGFIKSLSGYTLNDIVEDITEAIYTSSISYQDLADKLSAGKTYTFFHHYPAEISIPLMPYMGIFINQEKILDMICVKSGYTSSFDAGVDLSKVFLFCRDWYYEFSQPILGGDMIIKIKAGTKKQYKSISELLKQICLLNGIYFTVDEFTKVVSFSSISELFSNTPVAIETLKFSEKQLYTGYGYKNNINYAVGDGILSTTRNAVFYSDGSATSEALELEFLIPSKIDGKHNLTGVTDLVAASREGIKQNIQYQTYEDATYIVINTEWLTVPDLATVYSFMTDVFSETNVITAIGHIGSLQIDEIMQKRIITSVALGGTYFVEALNYNINTGNSVLTLIKL